MKRSTTKRKRGTTVQKACFLLAFIITGLVGCDSFIETEPLGQLTSENFFETQEQAVQATNATYNMLRNWTVHVFSFIGLTDIVSDESTKGSIPGDANFLGELDNLNFDPGNLAFRDIWTGYYQGIYRANIVIQNLPNVTMDETLKARLMGENKFLRAYFYFFLVRAFGGVPLITQPLFPGQFEQQRASAEEVYALIEQDLVDAIASLPEQSQYGASDVGRVTKGAARALLAEVHLYQDDYENAYRYATEVINSGEYSLYPNYTELFRQAGENSSESVFEVQAVALEQGGGGTQYSEVQGVRGTPNIGWGFNTPSDALEGNFEPGDPRLQATILYPWEQTPDGTGQVVYINPSMPNNRYNQKAYQSPGNPGGSGNSGVNIRRIRYAEVLLIAAEAAYQTGNVGEAQNYLNQVRQRARENRTLTLGVTPEGLSNTIATSVLGLEAGSSRVFVRYVNPESTAYTAGFRSFSSECADAACATADVPPVRVVSMDIIQSVNGTAVTTLQDYYAAVDAAAPGTTVNVQVLRVTQPSAGTTNRQTLTIQVAAQPLLPDITATGQQLLEAIWDERGRELGMEQQRWFDIIRQGRAPEIMAEAGKTFAIGKHELYPIPQSEVELVGLTQNPGY